MIDAITREKIHHLKYIVTLCFYHSVYFLIEITNGNN